VNNSSKWNNVGRGSWQNGSVTLGKGFALRTRLGGLGSEPVDCWQPGQATHMVRVGHCMLVRGWTENASLRDLPQASNNPLRIGTDKRNLTI
jgi:hypothetical protein